MSDITIVVSGQQTVSIIEVGIQGPAGGSIIFATTVIMFATIGNAGNIAYCLDYPDQHWKWSVIQTNWIPAF